MRLFGLFIFLAILMGFSSFTLAQEKPNESDETRNTKAQIELKDKGELTAKDIAQKRTMASYADGGYFDCRGWVPKDEPRGTCDQKKIRDFIWRHWNEKTRGYIRVTYNSVDARSTSHIFIEPDKNDEWSICWRIVRWHAIPQLSNQITEISKIVSIDRVQDKPKKGEWMIEFKNKSGKVMETMPDNF